MDVFVNVSNQKLKITTNLKSFVEGSQNFVRFVFNLTNDWDNLVTFAQFTQGGISYNQFLDDSNSVYLPTEIVKGTCTMVLYGSSKNVIATTNYLTLFIDKNILVHDAESTEISQSLYNQLIDRVNAMASVDAELQRQLNAKVNNEDLTLETNRAKQAEQANKQAIQALADRVTQVENNEVIDSIIEEAVSAELNKFLQSGQLANLAIQDGSLSRSKVDSDFESVLQKADTAVQPSDVQNLLDSLTVVVDALPAQGQNHVNYIVKSASSYTYYKWIDGSWQVIGSASSGGDLYIGTADSGFYISSEGEETSDGQPAKPVAAIYGQNGDEPVRIHGVADPIGVGDAANKAYVDEKAQEILNQIGAGGASGVTSINGKTGAVTMPSLDFGTCASGAAVRDKAITGVDASLPLLDGTTLTVRFTAANTAASPRLTVNGQTFIVYDWRTGQPLTADSLGACTHHFVLYGGAWVLLNPVEAEGKDGKSAYDMAVENGFTGTVQEWLASLQGAPGQDGSTGADGASAYQLAVANGFEGTLSEWLESLVGRGITNVKRTSGSGMAGVVDTYTITYSDGTTSTFTVRNGMNGSAGVGIKSFTKTAGTGAAGTTDTYTVTLTNNQTTKITVYNGKNGDPGEPGAPGKDGGDIVQAFCYAMGDVTLKIAEPIPNSSGSNDIILVDFSFANTATKPQLQCGSHKGYVIGEHGATEEHPRIGVGVHLFVWSEIYKGWYLINPAAAEGAGTPGADGRGIVDVARTSGNGAAGTVDTYTITYTDGTTSTFAVHNGADGGYYTPSVAADGMLSWSGSKEGMPPVAPIDLHDYIDTILPSGYCSTGAAVTDKIESFIDKTISNGSVVSVQFAYTNTAENPTLTVNSVNAPILDAGGQPVSPSALGAGRRLFLYSSASPTGWILLNPQTAILPTATAEDAGKAAIVGESGQYDLAYPQMPVVKSLDSNVVMQPNTFYRWGVMDRLTISFGEENPRIVNEFCGEFSSGTPATNFAVPASVNWVNALNIEPNKTYHFSIVNGIGVMMGV